MVHLQRATLEIITDNISRGTQSWQRELTVRWSGHKLRAVVDRDSYDMQSRIYVEVWSPAELKWNRVQTLSGKDYSDLTCAYSQDDAAITHTSEPVLLGMLAYAQEILSE